MALKTSLILLLSFISMHLSYSAKIAGFSGAASGSHYFNLKKVMEELVSRGHEVVLIKPAYSDEPPSTEQKVLHRTFKIPYTEKDGEILVIKTSIEESMWKGLTNLIEITRVTCESLLNDTELLHEIRDYDLIVYESLGLCATLVAELLDIPNVVIVSNPPSNFDSSMYKVPMPSSYVPSRLLPFSCEMSFTERVINFFVVNIFQFLLETLSVRSYSSLKEKYNITPEVSYREAVASAELVLFNGHYAVECPQPLLPGQIILGPIAVKPEPDPLPPDLADFIKDSGGQGFIIASFGSYAKMTISNRTIDVLAAAFGKLKQKIIWKHKGYIPSSVGPNIKVVNWIPQNDLLAHKDIKAFVSHAGTNSYYESAYHGVPVVAVPLFIDHFSNARKAEYFGIATVLDHQTMNAEELFEAIQLVMNEPRFKETAMRISRLMKDSPRTSLEKAGDWIEYVLRHGGAQHLRAQVFNMAWYQYYSLDVIAFLVAIAAIIVMVITLACRCLCRACCERGVGKNKND